MRYLARPIEKTFLAMHRIAATIDHYLKPKMKYPLRIAVKMPYWHSG
jgi:hypothetical protein